ncbi:hypothetical protein BJX76DRAFT_358044 [Aspergillus varians]
MATQKIMAQEVPHVSPLKSFTQGDFDRLSTQHEWIKGCSGGCSGLLKAPIDLSRPGLRVLDSATADGTITPKALFVLDSHCPRSDFLCPGTIGIWMKDVQTLAAPGTQFVGFDIAPDPQSPLPPNIHIQAQNILEPFPSEWQNSFDLVHQRLLLVMFSETQVHQILDRLIGTVKPGGWVQLFEGDASKRVYNPNAKSFEFFHKFVEKMESATVGRYLSDYLRDAGMINIGHQEVELQLGCANPDRELGMLGLRNIQSAVNGFMARFEPGAVGASEEEWRDLPEQLTRDMDTYGASGLRAEYRGGVPRACGMYTLGAAHYKNENIYKAKTNPMNAK